MFWLFRLLRPARHRVARVAACLSLVLAHTATAQVGYEFDAAYNGNYFIDAFTTGENTAAARYGNKIVRLPDGDVVVAGVMRLDNDSIAPYWNVGLVRYSPGGTRQVWSAAGVQSWAGGQYLIYPNLPNGGSGFPNILSVNDLAYAGGLLYVLTTMETAVSPRDREVRIVVFREDGSYVNTYNIFTSAADDRALALNVLTTNVVSKPYSLTVLAQRSATRLAVARYDIQANGSLLIDLNFGIDGRRELLVPFSECGNSTECVVLGADITQPQRPLGGANMPIYIAASIQRGALTSTDYDFALIKLTPDGLFDLNFGGDGVRQYAFDAPGSDLTDFATALVATRSSFGNDDTVWIAGSVNRRCTPGMGLVKTDGNGDLASTFGEAGRALYGGSILPPGPDCDNAFRYNAAALVLQDDEVAIAGTQYQIDPATSGLALSFGSLLRVSQVDGALRSLDTLPLSDASTGGLMSLHGITTGEGGGRYYVSGRGSWTSAGYASLYLSARLRPGDDTLFRNGFD